MTPKILDDLVRDVRTATKDMACGCGCCERDGEVPKEPIPGWTLLGAGRSRATYVYARRGRESRIVVKVPLGQYGEQCNQSELTNRRFGYGSLKPEKLARCRLVWVHSVPVIVMTRVTPLRTPYRTDANYAYDPVPDWAYSLDAEQCGTTPRGRIVAFDYA